MKFGFYSCMTGMPWGGSEVLWSKVAHRLLAEGHEVTVNFRHWKNQAIELDQLGQAGATLWLRKESYEPNWTTRLFGRFRQPANVQQNTRNSIKNWLAKEKPDLVLVTVGYHPDRIAPAEECIQRGIPYAINVQCASSTTFISDSFLDDFRRAYTKADRVFFVSKENQDKVETNIAMTLQNAEIVDNPFNVSYDANPPWPAETEFFDLACVGRIHFVSKGQDLLVHVLKQEKWRERNLRVNLFGKTQGNRQQMRELIDHYELRPAIRFAGYEDDVLQLWSGNHGLILPSRYEGAALVIVEAMMCNRFCVSTDTGRNRELIDEGETGFIAPAPTADFLDQALERAWQKRDQWQHMGQLAGQRIRERYGKDPVGDLRNRLLRLIPDQQISSTKLS